MHRFPPSTVGGVLSHLAQAAVLRIVKSVSELLGTRR